jgi:hypothetical protein
MCAVFNRLPDLKLQKSGPLNKTEREAFVSFQGILVKKEFHKWGSQDTNAALSVCLFNYSQIVLH